MDNERVAKELLVLAKGLVGDESRRLVAGNREEQIKFLREINVDCNRLILLLNTLDWDMDQSDDQKLGKHLDALRHLLDSASGRASTISAYIRHK